MGKDKVILHQYVLFSVLAILILWSVITGGFVFNVGLLWWLLGGVIGFMFVFTDKLINDLLLKSDETMSMRLKEITGGRRFSDGIVDLMNEHYPQKEMIMRSFLFLVVWTILAFLTVTSVVSEFARGFMLGIGTHLIFDLLYDFVWARAKFDQWFWQIKRVLIFEEKRWFVFLMTAVYVILALRF